ncbi:hypothetical protein, partial [Leptodesmis sp.]|uniref:hypothetical protein n=1 Tax=Leptodesmis sp. TaxID=3100501 RepID=UPI0040535453
PDAHPKRVERGAAAVKAQDKPKANPDKVRDIKNWVYRILNVNPDIPISISQLTCKEPGCPPIETVIAIMTQPVKQYKIHKAVDEIDELDICNLY